MLFSTVRPLLVYEELAKNLANIEQLEAYIKELERQDEQPAGELEPAAELSPIQNLIYAKDLLLTLLTDWSDNPAPPVGVFDSTKGGSWGGPMHSLEVRGKAVCACTLCQHCRIMSSVPYDSCYNTNTVAGLLQALQHGVECTAAPAPKQQLMAALCLSLCASAPSVGMGLHAGREQQPVANSHDGSWRAWNCDRCQLSCMPSRYLT
jgi:hypothetical protein